MHNLNLSSIELYFSQSVNETEHTITLVGDEYNHLTKVMRHEINDEIYVTNGLGNIFKCLIKNITNRHVTLGIRDIFNFTPKFPHITFCIPILRNNERLEFALEKCTELGITNFIIFKAERSIPKKINMKRIEKILISAMKQSLQSWLPKIDYFDSIKKLLDPSITKVIFDQSSHEYFNPSHITNQFNYYFIFGPEGGLTQNEINFFDTALKVKLAENRLRTETAVIKAASLL